MFWCPGPTDGFGVPFFVSGLEKLMGKLTNEIFFGVHGRPGVGFGVPFFVSGFCIDLWENSQIEYLSVCSAHGGWVWGAVLCV